MGTKKNLFIIVFALLTIFACKKTDVVTPTDSTVQEEVNGELAGKESVKYPCGGENSEGDPSMDLQVEFTLSGNVVLHTSDAYCDIIVWSVTANGNEFTGNGSSITLPYEEGVNYLVELSKFSYPEPSIGVPITFMPTKGGEKTPVIGNSGGPELEISGDFCLTFNEFAVGICNGNGVIEYVPYSGPCSVYYGGGPAGGMVLVITECC